MRFTAVVSLLFLTLCLPLSGEITVGKDGDYQLVSSALEHESGRAAEHCDFLEIRLTDKIHIESGIFIDGMVRITGNGPGKTIIQAAAEPGQAPDRVFRIGSEGIVEMSGITIRYGRPDEIPLRGGGIDNEGVLIMHDCRVSSNTAAYGAGIFTRGRTELYGCSISGNITERAPTAVSASGTGCKGSGAGIKTEKGATLLMRSCVVSGNSSINRGGGLFVACESSASIEGTLFSGNFSSAGGGGVFNKGELSVAASVISRNMSVNKAGGICNSGRAGITGTLFSGNIYRDFQNISTNGFYAEGKLVRDQGNFSTDGSCGTGLYALGGMSIVSGPLPVILEAVRFR